MFQEVLAWHVAKLLVLTRREQFDQIRAEVNALMERGLVDAQHTGTWLAAISMLSEAVAVLGDVATAATLYPKLLPYAQRNITVSFVACRGSVSRFLGLLAATMHRADDANRHFVEAVEMNRRMSADPHVATTLYDHAAFLARALPPARDVHRAFSLCREALQIAQRLGMEGLATRCEALLVAHAAPDSSDGQLKPREDFELSRSGSAWVISHAGREAVVKSRKGMLYVAELLRHPDRDVHTKNLVALFGPVESASPESRGAPVQDTHTGDFSEDLVDPKARRAYQRRLEDLEEQLDTAHAAGDPEELAVLREEHDALRREMSRITALGGRPRRIDDAERIRVAVTRAIRAALAEIANVAPEIGGALARRIRTGASCRYSSSDPPR